ncbi:MAG: hypothetical protein Q9159_004977 [Coniocarpon cinnabarinum]
MSALLEETLSQGLESRHTLLAATLGAVFLYFLFTVSHEPKANSSFPHVGTEQGTLFFKGIRQRLQWFKKGPSLIHSAFKEHKNAIFTLPSLDRTSIVLPPRFLQEIKELPSSIGNNSQATSDFFIGRWTTLDYDIFGHATIDAIKTQYITKIGSQIEPASNEAAYAFHKHFGTYPDWTPVAVQPRILQLVSQMVARTVIGSDVCRNSDWTSAVTDYAQNIFQAAVFLKLLPDIMHPFAAVFLPYFWRIRRCRRAIKKLAAPIIHEKVAWKRDDPKSWKAHLKDDEAIAVDWLVETSPPQESTVAMMAHRLTGVSFGASHTTSNTITNALMDLANDFDRWAPPLREEISEVLGDQPGEITNADLSKMWKLDSFLKESQSQLIRNATVSVNRKMLKPHTLSTGEVLPKNAHISFAGVPMSMSDDYFESAEQFDGFRFERLRRNPETNHNGLQFTSSYAGSLHFGHGKYMCPGRFMGSLISKLLLIEMLRRYDLKLIKGGRPESLMFFDMDIPDPKYEVLFRDRSM